MRKGGSYGRYRMPDRLKAAMAAVEYKFLDTDIGLTTIGTAGTVFGSINTIPQGDTETNRDGRRCVIKSIWFKAHVQVPQLTAIPTVANDHENLTLYLIQDKQANGAFPSFADVFQQTVWDTFRNLENSQRFNIIWQRRFKFNPITATDDGTTIVWVYNHDILDIYTKVNIPLEFSVGTTGVITTIKSNNLMLMGITEKGIAKVHGRFRIRFVG